MNDVIAREPAAFSAAVLVLVNAVLIALVAFGVTMSEAQTAAVMGLANALLAVVLMVWTRGKVTPTGGES